MSLYHLRETFKNPRWIPRFFYTSLFLFLALIASRKHPVLAENNPNAIYQKADNLFEQQEYGKALNLFEQLLTLDPSFVGGYRGIVSCYRALGDPQGAAIFIESLLLDNPENAAVNYGMGYSLFDLQKYVDAATFFDKAILLDPNLAEAWNNRAAIYQFIDKDFNKARSYYEKAVVLSGKANNQRVLDIARKNLASLPKKEVLEPVTETLTLETFINRFIDAVDSNNDKLMKELVLGQKTNCEEAMKWLLDNARNANARNLKEDEEAAVLLAQLLANLYEESFESGLLKDGLQNYMSLPDETKHLLAEGERLLEEGNMDQEANRYPPAEEKYRQALVCFKTIDDTLRTGVVYTYLGDLYIRMEDWLSAREAYQNSLSFFNKDNDMKRKAVTLFTLGKINYNLKEYAASLDFLNLALEAYRDISDQSAVEKVEQNIEIVKEKVCKKK